MLLPNDEALYAVDIAVLGGTHPAVFYDLDTSTTHRKRPAGKRSKAIETHATPVEEPVDNIDVDAPRTRSRKRQVVKDDSGIGTNKLMSDATDGKDGVEGKEQDVVEVGVVVEGKVGVAAELWRKIQRHISDTLCIYKCIT